MSGSAKKPPAVEVVLRPHPRLTVEQRAAFLLRVRKTFGSPARTIAALVMEFDHGNGAYPSLKSMGERTGYTFGTVRNYMGRMVHAGAFVSRREPGLGHLHAYYAVPGEWIEVIKGDDIRPGSSDVVTSSDERHGTGVTSGVTPHVMPDVTSGVTPCDATVLGSEVVAGKSEAKKFFERGGGRRAGAARSPDGGGAAPGDTTSTSATQGNDNGAARLAERKAMLRGRLTSYRAAHADADSDQMRETFADMIIGTERALAMLEGDQAA